jgi:hypothetical protein
MGLFGSKPKSKKLDTKALSVEVDRVYQSVGKTFDTSDFNAFMERSNVYRCTLVGYFMVEMQTFGYTETEANELAQSYLSRQGVNVDDQFFTKYYRPYLTNRDVNALFGPVALSSEQLTKVIGAVGKTFQ